MKILREMVRSTTMGMDAIDHVMPYVKDETLAETMRGQKERLGEALAEAKRGLTGMRSRNRRGASSPKPSSKPVPPSPP